MRPVVPREEKNLNLKSRKQAHRKASTPSSLEPLSLARRAGGGTPAGVRPLLADASLRLPGFCTAVGHPRGRFTPPPCSSASPVSSSAPLRPRRTPSAHAPSCPRRMKWTAGSSLTCRVRRREALLLGRARALPGLGALGERLGKWGAPPPALRVDGVRGSDSAGGQGAFPGLSGALSVAGGSHLPGAPRGAARRARLRLGLTTPSLSPTPRVRCVCVSPPAAALPRLRPVP